MDDNKINVYTNRLVETMDRIEKIIDEIEKNPGAALTLLLPLAAFASVVSVMILHTINRINELERKIKRS